MGDKFFLKILLLLFLFSLPIAWIDPFNDEVAKGNSNYSSGKFNEAINNYKEAEKFAPDEKKKRMLDFNRGNAEFKMNNHESALAKYRNSMGSGDPDLRKKALFNEGTTYMKMGKKKEAADSFIKALQIDPSYEKAKRNLEFLLKKNDDDKQNKNDNQKNGDKKNQDKQKTGSDRDKKGKSDEEKNSAQVKNMLESMKNKPVRRQKGNGNGKRYLEKNW